MRFANLTAAFLIFIAVLSLASLGNKTGNFLSDLSVDIASATLFLSAIFIVIVLAEKKKYNPY